MSLPSAGMNRALLPDAGSLARCRRVLVMGSNGSGKTTFARRLGTALSVDVLHLASLLFRHGWQHAPRDEFVRAQEPLVRREGWIIDGNCLSTFEVRGPFAEAIIVFDLPATLCVPRTVRRTLASRMRPRPDLPDGCPERLNWSYIRFLWRVCTFRRRVMPRLERCLGATPPGTLIIRIRSSRAAADLLRRLEVTRRQTS